MSNYKEVFSNIYDTYGFGSEESHSGHGLVNLILLKMKYQNVIFLLLEML